MTYGDARREAAQAALKVKKAETGVHKAEKAYEDKVSLPWPHGKAATDISDPSSWLSRLRLLTPNIVPGKLRLWRSE